MKEHNSLPPAIAGRIALGIYGVSGKSRILKLQRLQICSQVTTLAVCPTNRGALGDAPFPFSLALLMWKEMKGTVCLDLL